MGILIVACKDCGYRGEIDVSLWHPKIHCPKCYTFYLDKDKQKQPELIYNGVLPPLNSNQDINDTTKIKSNKHYDIVTEATDIIEASGRKILEKMIAEGKRYDEIKRELSGKLALSTIHSYFYESGGKKQPRDYTNTKTPPHAPKTGEYRKCLDCDKVIYITPSRLRRAKDENSNRRCRECALKHVMATRKPPKRKTTKWTILNYIQELQKEFLNDKVSEYKSGAVYACNLIRDFIENNMVR